MNILTNKEIVKTLLTNSERCRNSDNILMANVLSNHLKANQISLETPIKNILVMMTEDKLPNFESIRRIRQKLQEEHPELRGSNYKHKQKEQEKVKQQLGY